VLELTVGGGVDERIDAAVGELQHSTEVVEPVNYVMLLVMKEIVLENHYVMVMVTD